MILDGKAANHLLIIDNDEKMISFYLMHMKNMYPTYTYTLIKNTTSGLNRIYYNNFNLLLVNYGIKGEGLTGKKLLTEAMIVGKPVISYSTNIFSLTDYFINSFSFPVKNGKHLFVDENFGVNLNKSINKYINQVSNPIDISRNLLARI